MPTNYERGAYEPVDEVRVFDGGEDEDDVEGSRLPLLIVIALLVLAAFGGVVWLAYQRGVAQGHAEIPRVIAAEPGPVKVPPTNAGGATTPYTGLKIYQQPAPSNEDADSDSAPPTPSQALPTKPRPAIAAPATPASAPVVTKPSVKNMAATTVPPASAPAVKPVPVRKAETVQTKPVVLAPPESAPPAATSVATSATGAGGLLQIGAYKSEAEANTAWTTYKSKHASLLSGTSPDVKQVDLGAKGTWYRLRIATGDKSAAAALCEKLKAEGGACFPAK
jgi:hypothetical protein